MTANRWAATSLACAAALGALACHAQGAGAPRVHVVTIEAMVFSPATLKVRRGDTVEWRNKDLVPHTATAAGAFDSGNLAPGKSWSRPMTTAGTQAYVCAYHPTMKGSLIVE
ncbi:MAG TPA: cupredoxin family copper-binding protein [Ramlibacter sp.]|nr:cupredoxin family copper-binding protein [Ramlibacter sp.]